MTPHCWSALLGQLEAECQITAIMRGALGAKQIGYGMRVNNACK